MPPPPPPKKNDDSTRVRPNVAPKADGSTRLRPNPAPKADQSSKIRPNPQPVKRDESTRARAGQIPQAKRESSTRLRRAPRDAEDDVRAATPKKKSKALLFASIAAIVGLAGGVGTFAYVKSRKPAAPPVVKTPEPTKTPEPPPRPPRHGDPDVNTALLASDAFVEKGDFLKALEALDAGVAAIEGSTRADPDKMKLCRILRDEKDTVQLKRDDTAEVEIERARAICEEVDDDLKAWKLADAQKLLSENQRVLTVAGEYDRRKANLDAMQQAAPVLEPILARVDASGMGSDKAAVESLASSDVDEISLRARIILVRDAARPLVEEGRQALEARVGASKKRYEALSAGKKPEGADPNAAEGDFFYRPRGSTTLDPVMEKIPDGKLQEEFSKVMKVLRSFSDDSDKTGLKELDDLREFLDPFPAFHYYYALAAFFAGDCNTADGEIQKAVQAGPKFGEAWGLAARIAIERNKLDEADTALDKAEGLMPDLPEIYLYRALLNVYRQKGQAAKDMLAKAQKMAPGHMALFGTAIQMTNIIDGPKVDLSFVAQSANYIVKTDLSKERAQRILDELEAMRPHYAKVCGAEAKQQEAVPVLYFKSREEFDEYRHTQRDGVLGYYVPMYRQFVFYEVPNDLEGTLHVLRHEGFHQYVHMLIPNIPRWVNEALAEYTGGSKLEGGKVKEEGFVTPFLKKYRLDRMTDGSLDGKAVKDMLRNAYGYGPEPGYDDGWTLFHFLFKYQGGKYKERARIYIDALRAGSPPREAYALALPSKEYGDLYGEWKEHFNKLKKKSESTDD